MDWLNNPWVVGIVGGVLSGLLVTIISRALLSRRDKGEYLQKINSANREVVYAIRPGISEKQIPAPGVVASLISATARKYAVDPTDLFKPSQVGEELIKEVMDSSFVPPQTKKEYCESLSSLEEPPAPVADESPPVRTMRRMELAAYRSQMVSLMSVMLGVMTAVMTLFVVVLQVDDVDIARPSESISFLMPAATAILTAGAAASMMIIRQQQRRRLRARERREEELETKEGEQPS